MSNMIYLPLVFTPFIVVSLVILLAGKAEK